MSIYKEQYIVQASLAVVPILSTVYTVAKNIHDSKVSSSVVEMDIDIVSNIAILKCSVKSLYSKRIKVKDAFLFVDQGSERGSFFEFDYLLKHRNNERDCEVSKKCQTLKIKSYKDINSNTEGYFKKLEHLYPSTNLYIDPNEQFSDECSIKLKNGVYRAIFIVTFFDNIDCNCISKQFIIETHSKNLSKTELQKLIV